MQDNLSKIDQLSAALKKLLPMKPEFQTKLDKKFRLEFNYNSNHMEGNTLTYSETELLLIFDETKGNHTLREYEEMKAHDVALRLVKEWAADKERPLTEGNIKNLNEVILVKPFWKDAITPDGQKTRRLINVGDYKEFPNSVLLSNGEIFEYASVTDTPILMHELIDWYRAEEKAVHPVTLAAMLHYKFVRIHPFDDGNGRLARLLMNYVLFKNGFPPVIIKSSDKANYLRVLRIADTGEYEPLISYISEQLMWSLELNIKAAKGESVDEIGDLDKKLIQLRTKLKAKPDEEIRIYRSIPAIKTAFTQGIKPLIDKTGKRLKSFDSFFKSKKELLILNNQTSVDTVAFIKSVETNYKAIRLLTYKYNLNNFRNLKHTTFSTDVKLIFTFHENVYEITSPLFENNYSKLYDQEITEDEMTEISEILGTYIFEQIEKQIGE